MNEIATQVQQIKQILCKISCFLYGKSTLRCAHVPKGNGGAAWPAVRNSFASNREERVVALS